MARDYICKLDLRNITSLQSQISIVIIIHRSSQIYKLTYNAIILWTKHPSIYFLPLMRVWLVVTVG